MIKSKYLFLVAIVLVFATALYFSVSGVDFGDQWDQNQIKGLVNKYVRTGNILPGWYTYPPVNSYVASLTIVPYAAPFVARYGTNWFPTQQYLLHDVLDGGNVAFRLNLRSVFAFVSMLGVLWTGLAAYQRHPMAGFVAAAGLGLSWELGYYSRIVSPDGITMQGVALTLLFCMLAYYNKRPFRPIVWLGLAAAASALATATKYTAGITLFSVLIFAYLVLRQEKGVSIKRILLTLLGLSGIYVATFLILVPGAILEFSTFSAQVIEAEQIYAGGWGWQTVNAGPEHFVRIVLYLFQAAFSYNRVLALFFPALALVGIYGLVKSKGEIRLTWALGAVPLLYILFLSTHRVMFVRNLMVIFPYLAILSGIGFVWLFERLNKKRRNWRTALIALLAAVILFNVYWLNYTLSTIRMRRTDFYVEPAIAAIRARQDELVYVTPQARRLLEGHELPPNITFEHTGDEDLVLFTYDADTLVEDEASWPVNWPGAAPMIFGSLEINFDWYASWPANERLILSEPTWAWQDGDWLNR